MYHPHIIDSAHHIQRNAQGNRQKPLDRGNAGERETAGLTEPQMILLMLLGITGIFWMRSHRAKAPIQWSVGLFYTESIRRRADNFMRIADAACELHLIEKFQHLDGEVTADF